MRLFTRFHCTRSKRYSSLHGSLLLVIVCTPRENRKDIITSITRYLLEWNCKNTFGVCWRQHRARARRFVLVSSQHPPVRCVHNLFRLLCFVIVSMIFYRENLTRAHGSTLCLVSPYRGGRFPRSERTRARLVVITDRIMYVITCVHHTCTIRDRRLNGFVALSLGHGTISTNTRHVAPSLA